MKKKQSFAESKLWFMLSLVIIFASGSISLSSIGKKCTLKKILSCPVKIDIQIETKITKAT